MAEFVARRVAVDAHRSTEHPVAVEPRIGVAAEAITHGVGTALATGIIAHRDGSAISVRREHAAVFGIHIAVVAIVTLPQNAIHLPARLHTIASDRAKRDIMNVVMPQRLILAGRPDPIVVAMMDVHTINDDMPPAQPNTGFQIVLIIGNLPTIDVDMALARAICRRVGDVHRINGPVIGAGIDDVHVGRCASEEPGFPGQSKETVTGLAAVPDPSPELSVGP